MNKGMKMMMLSRSGDKTRRYDGDSRRQGNDSRHYEDSRNEMDNRMDDRYDRGPRSEYEGAYDYDRYRYKNGRFAPKPRSMHDGGMYDAFYDGGGRRHYDNGRYAPMRGEYDGGAYDMMGFDPYGNGRGRGDMYYLPDIYSGGHDDEERRKAEKRRRDRQVGYASGDIYEDDGEYFFKGRFGMDGRKYERVPDFRKMDEENAISWVKNMENADGSRGPHWKIEEVKQLIQQKGINVDFWPFYAALNAEYSDRCKVNEKYGINKMDFYIDSVIAFWFHDEDAVENKVTAYYECVVDHKK